MMHTGEAGDRKTEEAVHVISIKKLKEFWQQAKNPGAETALRWWYQQVRQARWNTPADVKQTFNTVDLVGRKMVFDVGGNEYRVIAVIDYNGHKVFIRFVMNHEEYDKGVWKKDTFGDQWQGRRLNPAVVDERGRKRLRRKRR